jgi:hypothetical protein
MPRQAAAAAGFAKTTRPMLKPPPDLNELEREAFLDIVLGARRPRISLPSDLLLVACYAKAIVQERIASGDLAAAGYVVDGKPSAWLSVWKETQRSMTTLARMLALSPGGRVPSKSVDEEPVSYYSRLALEQKRDEPN